MLSGDYYTQTYLLENGARPARVLMKGPMPCTHAAPQLLCIRLKYTLIKVVTATTTKESTSRSGTDPWLLRSGRPQMTTPDLMIHDTPCSSSSSSFHSIELRYAVLPLNHRNSFFLVLSPILSRGRPSVYNSNNRQIIGT